MSAPRPAARLGRGTIAQIVALDVALYAALLWRDYDIDGQMLVAHYVAFVLVTDIGARFLPAGRQRWFNVFRLLSGLTFLVLTVTLALKDLDGGVLWLSVARCALAAARTVHAGVLLRRAGPSTAELRAFPAHASRYLREGGFSERLSGGYAVLAALVLVFPQIFYWTHHNPGPDELDPVLVGLQASQALTVFLKAFVFETLIRDARARLSMRLVIALLFAVQWPMMLDMYTQAPLPYVHAIAEVFTAALVVAAFRARGAGARRPVAAGTA